MSYHLYIRSYRSCPLLNARELQKILELTCKVIPVYVHRDSIFENYRCITISDDISTVYFLLENLSTEDEILLRLKGEILFTCNKDATLVDRVFTIDKDIVMLAIETFHTIMS